MDKPILLFVETIRHSGGGVPGEYDTYFYFNNKFWYMKDYVATREINLEYAGYILEGIAHRIDYEIFKLKYNNLKKEYCLDEDVVDSCLREYALNNLLD